MFPFDSVTSPEASPSCGHTEGHRVRAASSSDSAAESTPELSLAATARQA